MTGVQYFALIATIIGVFAGARYDSRSHYKFYRDQAREDRRQLEQIVCTMHQEMRDFQAKLWQMEQKIVEEKHEG